MRHTQYSDTPIYVILARKIKILKIPPSWLLVDTQISQNLIGHVHDFITNNSYLRSKSTLIFMYLDRLIAIFVIYGKNDVVLDPK